MTKSPSSVPATGHAIAGILTAGDASWTTSQRRHDRTVDGDLCGVGGRPGAAGDTDRLRRSAAGKVVVDITNPLNFETFDSLVCPAGQLRGGRTRHPAALGSGAQEFNTTFAGMLTARAIGPNPPSVLVAGDDAGASRP